MNPRSQQNRLLHLKLTMVPWLDDLGYFPASVNALTLEDDADGLLCASTLINPELLHAAYSRGIYPWYNAGEPVIDRKSVV